MSQGEMEDNEAAGLLMLFSNQSKQPQQPSLLQRPPETEERSLSPQAGQEPEGATKGAAKRKGSSPKTPDAYIIDQTTSSPGPAVAALASGGSGNKKAMVAAAALAAAAAQPLPLPNEGTRSRGRGRPRKKPQQQQSQDDSAGLAVEKAVKTEDEAATTATTAVTAATAATAAESQDRTAAVKEEPKAAESKPADGSAVPTSPKPKAKGRGKKSKAKNNTPPDYAVDPDSGVIACICGYDHDDGFTIQCDRCYRWQHAVCMGINNIKEAPENYLCYMCDSELNIDADQARQLQEARMPPNRRRKSKNGKKSDKDAEVLPRTAEDEHFALKRYETFYLTISHYEYKNSSVMSFSKRLPRLLERIPNVASFQDIAEFQRRLAKPAALTIDFPKDYWRGKFTGIDKVGLYATTGLSAGQFLTPIYGELLLKQDYLEERTNQYWMFGTAKPNTFFHPQLPIVIDERALGNISRFTRKSCHPNCEIRTCVVGDRRAIFVLAAKQEIRAGQELTLPWEWEESHPINQLTKKSFSASQIDRPTRLKVINAVRAITNVTSCACPPGETCLIERAQRMFAKERPVDGNDYKISPTPNQTYRPLGLMYDRRALILEQAAENSGSGKLPAEIMKDDGKSIGADEASSSQQKEVEFQQVSSRSILNGPVVPPKYQAIRRFEESKEAAPSAVSITTTTTTTPESTTATTTPESASDVYTPFAVKPEVLDKLVKKDTNKENARKDLKREATTPAVQDKPKKIRKFSLADYKKKLNK